MPVPLRARRARLAISCESIIVLFGKVVVAGALSLSLSFSFLYRLRLTVSLLAQMSNRLHSIKLEDAKRPKWQTKRGVKDEEEEAAARACKRECDASLH